MKVFITACVGKERERGGGGGGGDDLCNRVREGKG